VAEVPLQSFVDAGFQTIEKLQDASDEELLTVEGLTESKITDLRTAINFLSSAIEGTVSEETDEAVEAVDADDAAEAPVAADEAPAEEEVEEAGETEEAVTDKKETE